MTFTKGTSQCSSVLLGLSLRDLVNITIIVFLFIMMPKSGGGTSFLNDLNTDRDASAVTLKKFIGLHLLLDFLPV